MIETMFEIIVLRFCWTESERRIWKLFYFIELSFCFFLEFISSRVKLIGFWQVDWVWRIFAEGKSGCLDIKFLVHVFICGMIKEFWVVEYL